MDARRSTDSRPGQPPVTPAPQAEVLPGNVPLGQQPYGQPVTRVDFFRRMPVGGTAYLKPAEPANWSCTCAKR